MGACRLFPVPLDLQEPPSVVFGLLDHRTWGIVRGPAELAIRLKTNAAIPFPVPCESLRLKETYVTSSTTSCAAAAATSFTCAAKLFRFSLPAYLLDLLDTRKCAHDGISCV